MKPVSAFPFALLCLLFMLSGCSGGSGDGASTSKTYISVQVSGTIRYEDKEYDAYGFTGNTSYKAVRFAVVDLVGADDSVIDTTVSDENGFYKLQGSGPDPRVRVMAQTSDSAGAVIAVNDFSGSAYAVSASPESGTNQPLDFDISTGSDIAGAFNMLDVYTSASQFVSELTTAPMPRLNVFWQNQSSDYGTYYCSGTRKYSACPLGMGIYILGGRINGGDSDHYDDDVLFHEFAHYVEGMVGVQDSPGGVHYLTENDQDLRLTWSEGLGGFFPAAVKTWLAQNHPQLLSIADGLPPTYFVDTYGSYVGISLDIADPNTVFCPWGGDCYVYSSSEIAVAKILLGLMDKFGMQAIWDIYANYMVSGTDLPGTLETFWDGWQAQRSPDAQEQAAVGEIFNDRLVFYQDDGYESDNNLASGNTSHKLSVCADGNCDGETHYLYHGGSDRDVVAFDATPQQSYFIETLDLSNGADTYIRILDASGNVVVDQNGKVMTNDDRPGTVYCGSYDNPCRIHNDDLMLSSELTFTPPKGGTYYVEITTSSTKPAAAGRYGTYMLQISQL
jgi:uncharacterized protein (DUF427 family)